MDNPGESNVLKNGNGNQERDQREDHMRTRLALLALKTEERGSGPSRQPLEVQRPRNQLLPQGPQEGNLLSFEPRETCVGLPLYRSLKSKSW